jgi:hypothetical protein
MASEARIDDSDSDISVRPAPLPVQWKARQATLVNSDGERTMCLVLELFTPLGIIVTFWDPDSGFALAKEVKRVSNLNQLGLIDPEGRGDTRPPRLGSLGLSGAGSAEEG